MEIVVLLLGDYLSSKSLLDSVSLDSSNSLILDKKSLTSLSSNTPITDCLFNLASLDHIGALSSASESANKGTSFACGQILVADDKCFSYLSLGTGSTNVENKVKKKYSTASLVNPEFSEIIDKLDLISSNTNCGESNLISLSYNANILSNNSGLISAQIKTLVSNMSIYNPCLLATPSFISSLISKALASDNLDFETIDLSSFFSNSTLKECFSDSRNKDSKLIDLANLLASSKYSVGTSNLIIISSIDNNDYENYINLLEFEGEVSKGYNNLDDEEINKDIKFEKIASIKTLEKQHVYDLAIEDTRNFIANDIVAHNTYIGNLVLASNSISTNNITSKSRNISFYNDIGSEIMKIDGGNARVGTT